MAGKKKTTNQNNLVKAADIPLDDLKRAFLRESPKNVEGQFSWSNTYYREWALKKILSRFELQGAPDHWDMDYFWAHLFLDGYVAVLDTELGTIPLRCGYTGLNVWERPTDVIIANPILGSFTRKIGVDAALIHLQFDYMGIGPVLDRFSNLLAMCDSALAVNLMNSKVAFIGFVDDQAQASTMQKMYDKITAGEPAVFVRKNQVTPESFIFANVRQSFVADDIMLLRRKIVNDFLSDIGINNANIDKRERLNEQEVNANNEEVRFNILNWMDCVQSGLDVANKLYGMGLTIMLREVTPETTAGDLTDEVDIDEFEKSN